MSLKYYEEERKAYPWHSAYRVNQDEALQICFRIFWALNLPALNIVFKCQDGSGRFTWSWFKSETKHKNRISLSKVTSIRTILHEIAHYTDYLNRVREIAAIDTSGCNGFLADGNSSVVTRCRIIRKEHYHGPRHRTEMAKLIKWFDENYRKNDMIDRTAVDMSKAA